ncbi:cyclic pyranopterin phosphate synthase [Brevundimonas sp. LM2]|uniref:GTP 3',8-cyclase MoaA n=1 Tax=Brevundimonas sp. LM2 TaxID=1938605 RepID=UPI000983E520|nr:GTP 3',8-cyclase MoaA [Brevundimonas sp. LM2]AQR63609.1 cyclic pyranopterin phosphate synthase [Brevundimonas sp. LM2]
MATTGSDGPVDAEGPWPAPPLADPFGRVIDYVRISETDRCDLRCTYCMTERQSFLPRQELLTIEELGRLCSTFIDLGAKRLRLTGGEPLIRKGFMDLVSDLSRHLQSGRLKELTLTTNGTQLARHAEALARYGVKRINVSVDTLDADAYRRITRGGDLAGVLEGLDAAQAAGLKVMINTVALKGDNAEALPAMIAWAHGRDMDITLIETMPLGQIEADRMDQYLPLSRVRAELERGWTLTPLGRRTGGPARYVRVGETGGILGFIAPMTHSFCETCNRVRVTCTGTLFLCLGQDDHADLKAVLRHNPGDDAPVRAAIREAIARKPRGHEFDISGRGAAPAVSRPMSMTGG